MEASPVRAADDSLRPPAGPTAFPPRRSGSAGPAEPGTRPNHCDRTPPARRRPRARRRNRPAGTRDSFATLPPSSLEHLLDGSRSELVDAPGLQHLEDARAFLGRRALDPGGGLRTQEVDPVA